MTLAQVYRQEGRQEGLTALRQAVVDLLQDRFGSVPEGVVETISHVPDLNKLRRLLRRAASCSDVEEFASEL